MQDLVFATLALGLFLTCARYVAGCRRLIGDDASSAAGQWVRDGRR